MIKLKQCPECEGSLNDYWAKGRKLQQHCTWCGWKGEIRVPESRLIEDTKTICTGQFSGFSYEMFDKYGCTLIMSRSYDTEVAAVIEIEKELIYGKTDKDAGPYTAVLWPDTVIVQGTIYK
jgi:hypothetical protein